MFDHHCQSFYEFYAKTNCPSCQAGNFSYAGRNHGIDVDAVKCWNCHHYYFLGEQVLFDDFYRTDDETLEILIKEGSIASKTDFQGMIEHYCNIEEGKRSINA